MNTIHRYHIPAFAALAIPALLAIAAAQVAPVTLTPPTSAQKAPAADGFIQRWLLLEPIGVNGLTESAVQAIVVAAAGAVGKWATRSAAAAERRVVHLSISPAGLTPGPA